MSFANFDIEAQKEKNPTVITTPHNSKQPLDDLSNKLSDFISYVSRIDKLQQQLGTKRDTPALRSNIVSLINKTNALNHDISSQLQTIEFSQDNAISSNKTNDADISKFGFTLDKLQTQFQEGFKNYLVVVRAYNEKIQSVSVNEQYSENNSVSAPTTATTNLLTQNATYGSTEDDSMVPSHIAQQQQLQMQEQIQKQQISESELALHEEIVIQRDQAITNISKGVQDINKIFSDLNEIVSQQGEQIDTIEDNLISYSNDNQMASRELVKADEYQRKKGKWSCIILVALVVISLIVLAVIS